MMNDLGPLFISPLINGSSLMNTSSYNEVSILNPIFTYGKRELRDLEPFSGRQGLIRSDWLDGSAEKRPGTLELYGNPHYFKIKSIEGFREHKFNSVQLHLYI